MFLKIKSNLKFFLLNCFGDNSIILPSLMKTMKLLMRALGIFWQNWKKN